jgi:hypothetical protein
MDASKRDIAWLIASVLDRTQPYTAADIERLIRTTIRQEYLNNPMLAPDHIRVAMVEAGFVTRDSAGAAYRVSDDFVGPEEIAERERALLTAAGELGVQGDVVVCPACGTRVGATSLLGHCQRWHDSSGRWPTLVERYCR